MTSAFKKLFRAVCVAMVILVAGCSMTFAQLYTGSLTGVVQDPSGAVIPNAKLTLTDSAKGFKYEGATDSGGRYLFRSLTPADYKLSVTATGFATTHLPQVTININQNATFNITLKVGRAAESVEVIGGAEQLQTQDATVGQVLDRNFVNELPLVGRQIYDLAMLAPGVSQPTGKAYGSGSSNNFVSQGSRNAQADVVLDGVSTTNYEQNTGFTQVMYTPSPDAVQEFKVQQTNFSAEFGFTGATVVNVVTRSGSNAFHGSAYEFLRNTMLNSEDYFLKQVGTPKPAYHWNNFGGTIGGPIIKNKVFFFFNYDGSRQITPTTVSLGLPTDAERNGDFGAVCSEGFNASGMCNNPAHQLWDPYMTDLNQGHHVSTTAIPYNNLGNYTSQGWYWTGQYGSAGPNQFVYNGEIMQYLNAVQGNLINPVAKAMLAYIPRANVPGAGLNNNYYGAASNTNNNDQFDAKIDAMITSKDTLSLRFSHQWLQTLGANIFGNAFDANTQGPVSGLSYQLSANYTRVFSPKTSLSVLIGGTHNWTHTKGLTFDATTIGLPANIAQVSGIQVAPAIQIDGYAGESGNANFGGQGWDSMLYGQDLGHVMGTVSHSAGRHELKFGGEVRLHRINFTQWELPGGHWQFSSAGSAQDLNNGATGGDGMASFMMGWATGWNLAWNPASPATQNWQYAGFFQDNWRVSSKLTLNLGFRYDLDLPRTERHDRMSYFDPNVPAPIQLSGLSAADLAGCPACANLMGSFMYVGGANSRSPFDTYYGAIGPRFGFAYQPIKDTVIRGGFGIYYDPSKGGAAGTGSGGAGFQGYDVRSNWGPTDDAGKNPASRSVMGTPFGVPMSTASGKVNGVYTQLGADLANIPVISLNTLPREYSWSLGVERRLPWNVIADVEYVGKRGENLYMGGNTYYLDHLSADDAQKFRANPDYYTAYASMPQPLCNAIQANTAAWSNPAWGCSWPRYNGLMPYPQYAFGAWGTAGLQTVDPPIGKSDYHGFMFKAEKQMSNGLQFLATYAIQKSMDDSSIAGANVFVNGTAGNVLASVQDPNNLDAEYSLSQFDMSKILQVSAVYQLPFGKGKQWSTSNAVLDRILGSWNVSGTYRWDSGLPIILGLQNGKSIPGFGNQRPDLNAPLVKAEGVNINGYFADPGAATAPLPYYNGTAPRVLSSVRAPGTNNVSMMVSKDFPLHFREGMYLKFRWETFNLFNHVQFGAPNGTVGNPSFGQINTQANTPRIQQVSLRLTF